MHIYMTNEMPQSSSKFLIPNTSQRPLAGYAHTVSCMIMPAAGQRSTRPTLRNSEAGQIKKEDSAKKRQYITNPTKKRRVLIAQEALT